MTSVLMLVAIFVPLVGVAVIRCLPLQLGGISRWVALGAVLLSLVATGLVVAECLDPLAVNDVGGFPATEFTAVWFNPQLSLAEQAAGTADSADQLVGTKNKQQAWIQFSLGLDGLSLWLFALVPLLVLASLLMSWDQITERVPAYYSLLLTLQVGMAGVFAARDIILFYVFFEATLIPLFFLIGAYGGDQRQRAAGRFFIFTFSGSVLTFLGLLVVVLWNYITKKQVTFSIAALTEVAGDMPAEWQLWVFLALFVGFAIKTPIFPLHTWLPLVYTQAPAAITVLLSGILAKMGTYGFARFNLSMFPEVSNAGLTWMLGLAAVSILYGGVAAVVQTDMKRMVAYASFSHLGFCILGLFAANRAGIDGAVIYMVGHALSSAGLFATVGMLYDRHRTQDMTHYGGLAGKYPTLCTFMVFFALASAGLPGLSGFIGEFLTLLGAMQRTFAGAIGQEGVFWPRVFTIAALLGIIVGAWYVLLLLQQVFFGRTKIPGAMASGFGGTVAQTHSSSGEAKTQDQPSGDLSIREILSLAPLLAFVLWLGLVPHFFLQPIEPTTSQIARGYQNRTAEDDPQQAAGRWPVVKTQDLSKLTQRSQDGLP